MNPEWVILAKTTGFKRKVEDSKRIISQARDIGTFAVSWSGGKDSTAMCHLVKSIIADCPIVVQIDDCDWPEKTPYIDCVSSRFGWEYHVATPDFSVWEMMNERKIGRDEFCRIDNPVTIDGFLKPLDKKRIELGCSGWFMGLRAEESRNRRLNYAKRGAIYSTKGGVMRCLPVVRWSASDVFAYHVDNGIEINPCYLNNRFKKPEDIRLSWAVPTPMGMSSGDIENLRYHYPQQFRKLRERGM